MDKEHIFKYYIKPSLHTHPLFFCLPYIHTYTTGNHFFYEFYIGLKNTYEKAWRLLIFFSIIINYYKSANNPNESEPTQNSL